MRRLRWSLVLGVLTVVLTVGTALAAFPPQVNPTSVPLGLLVVQSRITDSPVDAFARILHSKDGMDVFVNHVRYAPGVSSGWHNRPGPIIANVVAGRVTVYNSYDKGCIPHTYGPGQGWIEPGPPHSHDVRNEGSVPVDFYVTLLLPAGVDTTLILVPDPGNCPAWITEKIRPGSVN